MDIMERRAAEVEKLVKFLDPLFLNDSVTQDQRTAIKDAIYIMRGAAAGAYDAASRLTTAMQSVVNAASVWEKSFDTDMATASDDYWEEHEANERKLAEAVEAYRKQLGEQK